MDNLPVAQPSPNEINTVKLLDYVQALAEKKSPIGALQMKVVALDAMVKNGVATPIKIVPTSDNPETASVYFTVDQLYEFVKYTARLAKLKIWIDGTVVTKDGLILPRAEF